MTDILEAMRERRSCRTYTGAPLSAQAVDRLTGAVKEADNPFGAEVTVRLLTVASGEFRPSAYGVIKNAPAYFLIACGSDSKSMMGAGFVFEQIVLEATREGLSTCWIGGTFKGASFAEGEEWPDGAQLVAVSPVGLPASPRPMEKFARIAFGSNRRKPFGELFFDGNASKPLARDSKFGESLEMVRLAPSSTNSQPWRAIVCGDTVHFYYIRKSRLSVLDGGIGLCHFWLAEKSRGHDVRFFNSDARPAAPAAWTYLVSCRRTTSSE